jgi:hypothetical protein
VKQNSAYRAIVGHFKGMDVNIILSGALELLQKTMDPMETHTEMPYPIDSIKSIERGTLQQNTEMRWRLFII